MKFSKSQDWWSQAFPPCKRLTGNQDRDFRQAGMREERARRSDPAKDHTADDVLAQAGESRIMAGMELEPHLNLWLEREGEVVLSRWRVELLQAIADSGSISAAAERMGVDYHRAWDRLQEMERGLSITLVDRQMGGVGGGGARLTAAGEAYVARFSRFAQAVDEVIEEKFREAFGG